MSHFARKLQIEKSYVTIICEIERGCLIIKRGKKKHGFLGKFFGFLCIVLLIVGGWFAYQTFENGGGLSGALATLAGHNSKTVENLDKIEVLIMGESGAEANYKLADTIMIASYDPKTQQASLLSIPRDTYVGNKNRKTAKQNYLASYKINAVYQNGKKIDEAIECINNVTGMNLKYYVIIDTDALIEIVDAIGGVNYTVPIDMKYDDRTQNLHINLKAGEQLMDGAKAEQLLRFRHNNDGTTYPASYGIQDIGRMRTQREFISATLSQVMTPKNILNIPKILDVISKNVKTNLNFNVLKDYVPYAVDFSTENLKTGVLPGESELCNKVWIYVHDPVKTKEMIDELFFNTVPSTTEE